MKKKKKAKRVELYVVKRGGYSLTGYGYQSYGNFFEMGVDAAEMLAISSPQIFSLDDPLATHELKEVEDVV